MERKSVELIAATILDCHYMSWNYALNAVLDTQNICCSIFYYKKVRMYQKHFAKYIHFSLMGSLILLGWHCLAFFVNAARSRLFLQIASKLLSSSYWQRKKDESHRLFHSTSAVFIMGEQNFLIRILLVMLASCHFTADSFAENCQCQFLPCILLQNENSSSKIKLMKMCGRQNMRKYLQQVGLLTTDNLWGNVIYYFPSGLLRNYLVLDVPNYKAISSQFWVSLLWAGREWEGRDEMGWKQYLKMYALLPQFSTEPKRRRRLLKLGEFGNFSSKKVNYIWHQTLDTITEQFVLQSIGVFFKYPIFEIHIFLCSLYCL